jgi:hypothetical protein
MLLLGTGIGVGYNISQNGFGKKQFEDLTCTDNIQLRE